VRCDGACDVMTLPVLQFCSPIMKLLEPAHRTTRCRWRACAALEGIAQIYRLMVNVTPSGRATLFSRSVVKAMASRESGRSAMAMVDIHTPTP
jgi:hypothetical protein